MKSTQRNAPRRGWTLRGIATDVLTCGHASFSLLVLSLGVAALLAQTGCVGATAKASAPTTTSTTTTTPSNTAPSILAQVVSQTVATGQTATFSVSASGTAPLLYQWNKNGAAISGATAPSYTTPATATADNGTAFSVTVTNSVSSITSNSAVLTVNSSNFVISAAPSAFSFTATVNGTAPALQAVEFVATPATPLPFSMTANQPWITMTASSGVTKSDLQFGVNTTGMAVGTYNGQILVTPTGAGNPPMTIPVLLTITSAPAAGALTANVSSLNFNSVNEGSSSTLQAVLTNTGSTSINVSNVSISGAGFSASGLPAGTILTAGQTATLNVTFAPSASGSATGSVTVASNASNSTEAIPLVGVGVQVAQHSVSLTWAETTGSVAGYNIYQSTVSGGSYTMLNSSLDSSESYTDTSVQAGQTYYYVVTSVDPNGVESGDSNQVSVVIP